ncbi:MAG: 3-dehydroquinate synthase [Reinekea sp.]|jgi:3-dehydroquinate synthase
MKTLTVDLGDRSYPIHIGNCLSQPDLILNRVPNKEVVIVTNDTIAPLYLNHLMTIFEGAERKVQSVVLTDGEAYKNLEAINQIISHLLQHNISRKVALVALGGGVVGDITGFAAASYQRGVDFVQVPTTLLSQVDSSVGGKTGVNHPLGKNMIGAFKQPLAVFIDPSTLESLPQKELIAGFAEVIKHGAIYDIEYFSYLEQHIDAIFALDKEIIVEAILRSCQIKASVVAQDETEQGLRAILNFGHTFGHAVETTLGYGKWLHGEAIGLGLVMAADLSARLSLISEENANRIARLVEKSGLPVRVPESMTEQDFITAMYRDKKVDAGSLRLVLLRRLGDAYVTDDFSHEALDATLSHFCQ